MTIFKYCGDHAETVISRGTIKVSRADEFNDPFELIPNVNKENYGVRHIKQLLGLEEHVRDLYLKQKKYGLFTNYKRFKREVRANPEEYGSEILRNLDRHMEEMRGSFASDFNGGFRVFCASAIKDSILMWSHYAKSHTGVVYEFDTGKAPFCEMPKDMIFPVDYLDNKADFSYNPKNTKGFRKALINVAARKSTHWSYEREVRLIFPCSQTVNGNLITITPESLSAVYFGARMESVRQYKFVKALNEPLLAHVKIYKAALSDAKFELVFEQLR